MSQDWDLEVFRFTKINRKEKLGVLVDMASVGKIRIRLYEYYGFRRED